MLFGYEDHVSHADTAITDTDVPGETVIEPIANLKTRALSEVYQRTHNATNQIDIDFGSEKAVRVVAMLNHNVNTPKVIAITLKDGASVTQASIVYSMKSFPGEYTVAVFQDFGQTYTNIQHVSFAWNQGFSEDLIIGRLWAGPALVPAKPGGRGYRFGVKDPSDIATTRGGQSYADPQQRLRKLKITLPALTEVEAFGDIDDPDILSVQNMMFANGTHKEMIIVPYTGNDTLLNKWSIYGHLTRLGALEPTVTGGDPTRRKYRVDLVAEEEF